MRRSILVLLALALPAAAIDSGKPLPAIPPAANFESGKPPLDFRTWRGKVMYVDVWASWCVPCRTSMPVLEALYRKHRDRGFVVVGINKDERSGDAQRFLQRYPATFPQAVDADDHVVRALGVVAMPSGFLVDRKGLVRAVHQGFTADTAASLERDLEVLLEEAP